MHKSITIYKQGFKKRSVTEKKAATRRNR